MNVVKIGLFILLNIVLCSLIFAQITYLQEGISLYEQGKFKKAIKKLEKVQKGNKDLPVAKYYIGLSYEKRNKLEEAIRAYNESILASPQYSKPKTAIAKLSLKHLQYANAVKFAEAAVFNSPEDYENYYILGTAYRKLDNYALAAKSADKLIKLKPNFAGAYLLKSNTIAFSDEIKEDSAQYYDLLNQKDASLGKYVEILLSSRAEDFSSQELRALRFFDEYYKQKLASANYRKNDDTERTGLLIKSKPKPGYTDAARKAATKGEVKMLIAFLHNGKVGETFFLERLGNGLDEAAVKAAKNIKFEPPTENGKRVTTVKIIHYNFNIRY